MIKHVIFHCKENVRARDVRRTVTVMAVIYTVANGFGVDRICTVSSTSLSHTIWAVEKTAVADEVTGSMHLKNACTMSGFCQAIRIMDAIT
jgi:hypothetical protein